MTLNRPEVKNALNPTLIGELRAVFDILRDRRDIKVVILRGAGGTFCAGADLKNMEQSFGEKPKPGEKDPIASGTAASAPSSRRSTPCRRSW